jgi:hypothetical protein
VVIPALATNHSFARIPHASGTFSACRYPTPGRANGTRCGPPPPIEPNETVRYLPFDWPRPWPEDTGPLSITELGLRPEPDEARFIELHNHSTMPISLGNYTLRLSRHAPGAPWPGPDDGVSLALPARDLAPDERVQIPVAVEATADLETDPAFEGVLTLFVAPNGRTSARVDFMSWPRGATLARFPESRPHHRFCALSTPGQPNSDCAPLASRTLGERARHLRTPRDFATLAAGGTGVGMAAVKFIVDMQTGDVVHLLNSADWDLHYTFARERIYAQSHLDRCDPAQAAAFNAGWARYSQDEYFRVEERRFLQGTLVHHVATDHYTLEFASGDRIAAHQMERAFFQVAQHLDRPERWALRPRDSVQVDRMKQIEGRAPIIGPNAPYRGQRLQLLSPGVGYGTLKFIPSAQLAEAQPGHDVIILTDDVPNDIPFVGGLITETFQTPLAHVNVLSKSRDTPNMALRNARQDDLISAHLDQLVRYEVTASAFTIRRASAKEAEAFWQNRRPSRETRIARLDNARRGILPLENEGFESVPAIGGKAAQLAELRRVSDAPPGCTRSSISTPQDAFAIPVVHYVEHARASGATAKLSQLLPSERFRTDPLTRRRALGELRQLILDHPGRHDTARPGRARRTRAFRPSAGPLPQQQQCRGPARLQRGRALRLGQRRARRPRAPHPGCAASGLGQPLEYAGLRRARVSQRRPHRGRDGSARAPGLPLGARERRRGQSQSARPSAR